MSSKEEFKAMITIRQCKELSTTQLQIYILINAMQKMKKGMFGSSKWIAEQLNLNPHTTRRAMNELEEKGYLFQREAEGRTFLYTDPGLQIDVNSDPYTVSKERIVMTNEPDVITERSHLITERSHLIAEGSQTITERSQVITKRSKNDRSVIQMRSLSDHRDIYKRDTKEEMQCARANPTAASSSKLSLITQQQEQLVPQSHSELSLIIEKYFNDDEDPTGARSLIAYPEHRMTPRALLELSHSYRADGLSLREGITWAIVKILAKPQNSKMPLGTAILYAKSETRQAKEQQEESKQRRAQKQSQEASMNHVQRNGMSPVNAERRLTAYEIAEKSFDISKYTSEELKEAETHAEERASKMKKLISPEKYQEVVKAGVKEYLIKKQCRRCYV